jgi:synaptobrevin family protein YKT6
VIYFYILTIVADAFTVDFLLPSVREMIVFFDKTIAKRTPLGQRQSVQNEGLTFRFLLVFLILTALFLIHTEYFVHVYMRTDGLCGCVTCDSEYPPRVAFTLLTKILEDNTQFNPAWQKETRNEATTWPQLDQSIIRYQDPANADQIMKIQKNLDETRDILHNTIDNVLQRGEKLEDLVERSGELSAQSKLFYREAKRANSCCSVV